MTLGPLLKFVIKKLLRVYIQCITNQILGAITPKLSLDKLASVQINNSSVQESKADGLSVDAHIYSYMHVAGADMFSDLYADVCKDDWYLGHDEETPVAPVVIDESYHIPASQGQHNESSSSVKKLMISQQNLRKAWGSIPKEALKKIGWSG